MNTHGENTLTALTHSALPALNVSYGLSDMNSGGEPDERDHQ